MVTLNSFVTDSEEEIDYVEKRCRAMGCSFALSEVWAKGGEGGVALAEELLETMKEKKTQYHPLYPDDMPLEKKIETIAKKIYGADGVTYAAGVRTKLKKLTEQGYGQCPVCMAKTQYSLSDQPKKLGRPKGFKIQVRQVNLSAGAGFVVALTGDIMTMPGLPKHPAAEGIDVDDQGRITGLF